MRRRFEHNQISRERQFEPNKKLTLLTKAKTLSEDDVADCCGAGQASDYACWRALVDEDGHYSFAVAL